VFSCVFPSFFNDTFRVFSTQDERCPESSWPGSLVRRQKTSAAFKRYIYYTLYIYYIYLLLYPISLHHSAYYFVAYVLLIFAKYCTQDNWRAMVPHKGQQLQSRQDHILGEHLPKCYLSLSWLQASVGQAGNLKDSNKLCGWSFKSSLHTFTVLTCSKLFIGTACKGAYVGLLIDCHMLTSCLSYHRFGFKGTHRSSQRTLRPTASNGTEDAMDRGNAGNVVKKIKLKLFRQKPSQNVRHLLIRQDEDTATYCNHLLLDVLCLSKLTINPDSLGQCTEHLQVPTFSGWLMLIITYYNHPAYRNLWGTKVLAIRTSLQSSQGAAVS
jgi:hypothetical protein